MRELDKQAEAIGQLIKRVGELESLVVVLASRIPIEEFSSSMGREWLEIMVRLGRALANSANSGSWGKNTVFSSTIPKRASTSAPSRKMALDS